MRAAVVICSALCACSGPTKPPHVDPPSKPEPGLVWATTPAPYHLPHADLAIGSDGNQLMVVGPHSWIAVLDPATGSILRQVRGDHRVTFENVVSLGHGKWLASALKTEASSQVGTVYVIDGATLETKELALTRVDQGLKLAIPHVEVLDDGGVLITGRGLPLAIYDPSTGAVRRVLDPRIEWNPSTVRGHIVVTNFGGAGKRWDLATNAQKDLPRGWTHAGIGDGVIALRMEVNHVFVANLLYDDGTTKALPGWIDALTTDATGKRLITAVRGELRVHALPSGDIIKRIPIRDTWFLDHLYLFGNKLVVSRAAVLRIVDLDTGIVTPPHNGAGAFSQIAVDNDGHVLAGGQGVYTFTDGKQTAAIELGDSGVENFRHDDPSHYLTSSGADISLHTVGDPATKTWELPSVSRATWLGNDGNLLIDPIDSHLLLKTKGTEVVTLFQRSAEAELLDVDPDGDMMVALEGRVAVASLDGKLKATITMPECLDNLPEGVIEVGGKRAVTYTDANLALWDRTTGKLLASATYAEEPNQILFVPKRQELLLLSDTDVVSWLPGKGTHTLAQGDAVGAVSSDGKRLALGHVDGHVSLWNLDALLAGPLGPDLPASTEIKATCGTRDPLAPNPPDPD